MAALLLSTAARAAAETVDATATTLLAGRQDARDGTVHTVVPAYEDISLAVSDLKIPGVTEGRILVSAWGGVIAGDPIDGDHVTGDVDVAFIEGKLFERHLGVRAGRQLIVAGVARSLQLDGLSVLVRP
jgi:hypothetical protein